MKKELVFLILWSLLILTISVTPEIECEKPMIPGFDKVAHFGFYVYPGYLAVKLFGVYGLAGVMVFGGLNEFPHLFLPKRSFSWIDLLANILGALAGFLIIRYKYGKAPPS